ncbi:MAG: winged helix-turn-helix transcriptional regulator [Chthoniobacterales bacterium]|nr:winged helix-turn-helix transcriptional regulator [Chthoniobacterales bacterium]
MELIRIYQCLCDQTRLRILSLLTKGALCVCHFQEILELPQAKVSQHLAYLRKHRMVETLRKGTWIIYNLPSKPSRELEANLRCLQDCVTSDKLFRTDLARLAKLKKSAAWIEEAVGRKSCC